MSEPIREALAAYAHDAWAGWMRYLFNCSTLNSDGSVTIPPSSVARWQRQIATSYAELPPNEQVSDLAEADKMLALVAAARPRMSEPISDQERAAWQAAYEKAQRVAPGLWALLVDPPNLPRICHYPTDDIASRRIVPPHLWAYSVQVEAVNALPRLLAALTACEAERDHWRTWGEGWEQQGKGWQQRALTAEAENTALQAERDAARDEAAGYRAANARLRALGLRAHSMVRHHNDCGVFREATCDCGMRELQHELVAHLLPAELTQPPLPDPPDPAAPQQLGLLEDGA